MHFINWKRTGWIAVVALVGCGLGWGLGWGTRAGAEPASSEQGFSMLAHNVYFSLQDTSPAARQKLIAACEKHLTNHPGTVFFACGSVADLDRPVNDRDFDIGLHMVFKDRAAHDAYQEAPRHKQFIAENQANWKKVRVFDTDVRGGSSEVAAR